MVATGLALEPGDDTLRLAGIELPILCTVRAISGLPCPGCGLTRSVVAALHGELARAVAAHPIGPLVLAWLLLEGARHALWLAVPKRRAAIEVGGRLLDRGGLLLAGVLFATWVVRLVAGLL